MKDVRSVCEKTRDAGEVGQNNVLWKWQGGRTEGWISHTSDQKGITIL